MTFTLEHLEEPYLQFGAYFEHQDCKTGLAEYGPFGQNIDGLHPSEIKLGFIGTRESVAGAKEWVRECGSSIESRNIKAIGASSRYTGATLFELPEQRTRVNKILNRDFIGFNRESSFNCCFQINDRWDRFVTTRDLEDLLRIEDKQRRIWELVELFDSQIESLATTSPEPTIIILALTPEIVEYADSVQISGNYYLNFRRAIKAKAMRWGIPLQLLQRRTVLGTDRTLQEKTQRAWNFCTAQYYKADGIPWRTASLPRDTCFIGISFYVAQDLDEKTTMRSSVAQAFDYLGQGLVLRGNPFAWNTHTDGPSPHLTKEAASALIRDTLKAYVQANNVPPRRVVIHKTSEFWGPEHGQYNELDGFYEGIDAVYAHREIDLVSLRQTGLYLFREGKYPPLRGTYCALEGQHFLHTMGFIPYLNTYPGAYIPEPWQITDHHGESAPKELLCEVLALTKMNVNNCTFADGVPITLSFSQKIGDIMKHIPEDEKVQPTYKFYM